MTGSVAELSSPSRRAALAVFAGGAIYSCLKTRLALGETAQVPFPDRAGLPRIALDVEGSVRAQTLVLADGRRQEEYPGGCRIVIPAGVTIPIAKWVWEPARQAGRSAAVRLSIEGPEDGARPRLQWAGSGDMLRVYSAGEGRSSALDLVNLDIQGGPYGDAFRPDGLSQLTMVNIRISGGRNCMLLPTYPTEARLQGCEFRYGGFGDGFTHTVYVNYIKSFVAVGCIFHSPRTQGHALKSYAAENVIHDCRIAAWLNRGDFERGYGGDLPVMDMGAWANSLISDNVITRLPPARDVCIDFRNRQWRKGYSRRVPPDWGTEIPAFAGVDNGNPRNRALFHHFVENNLFVNGVAPSGEVLDAIREHPGYALRNNGTTPWNSEGFLEYHLTARPLGWTGQHERSVVWMSGNRVTGVPFKGWFLDQPHGDPSLTAPVRRIAVEKKDVRYPFENHALLARRLQN